jgi:hypothetical protein
MEHYILTKVQRDNFLERKAQYQNLLDERHVDIYAVELKGGLFAFPISVFNDARFNDLKNDLTTSNTLQSYTIREIQENELIIFDITKL